MTFHYTTVSVLALVRIQQADYLPEYQPNHGHHAIHSSLLIDYGWYLKCSASVEISRLAISIIRHGNLMILKSLRAPYI